MKNLYIGLMSGTSMDGVDAVLIEMDGGKWQGALAHAFLPYGEDLRHRLLALQDVGVDELHRAKILALELAQLYAQVVNQLLNQMGLPSSAIRALGCHGQTVRHAPKSGYSVQLVDLAKLAHLTGMLTVGDFRSGDLANGGQGAPLVPAFHAGVFADGVTWRVVLNIGGIANISVLPPDDLPFGFDTGAGNILMDAWVREKWHLPFDENGQLARQGRVLPDLLGRLLAHEYFRLPFPKSTGRELFSLAWLRSHLKGDENPVDVLATLVQFSACSMVEAIVQATPETKTVFVCGGGIKNAQLMAVLGDLLRERGMVWHSTAQLNLNPQWVEGAAFAWLAGCWCERLPSNPVRATGANRALVLGAGYFA